MNIETLKVFKDLIETGSFSRAARLNFISQSAVSQQIKKLELIFRGNLFEKKEGNIILTESGKILYESVKKIILIYQEAVSRIKMKNFNVKKAELKISSIYTVGLYLAGDYISNFLNLNPFIKINLDYKKCNEIVKDVERGKADFGFIASKPVNRKNIVSLHLVDEEMVLIAHPSCYLDSKYISLKDISRFNLVLFEKHTPSRQYLEKILKEKKIRIKVTMEMENIEVIKASVMSNTGVSIVPLICVKNEENEGKLKVFRFKEGKIFRPVFLIYNKKKMSLVAGSFLNMILDIKKNKEIEKWKSEI